MDYLLNIFRVAMDETNTVWEVRNPALKGTKKDSRLRMSRSFGDFYLKQNKELPATLQGVTATPEVNVHEHTNRCNNFAATFALFSK